tara:strand:- start:483 stop:833 length:351 start_codon:yes stop_codon:yes gene_type:complete
MLFPMIKAIISGALIALISEIAKRSPALGALVASLPIVSILAMIWLWRETQDSERIAVHAETTFWLVLPSLPMFLILPALLRHGMPFYIALSLSCGVTILLYMIMITIMKKFGVSF